MKSCVYWQEVQKASDNASPIVQKTLEDLVESATTNSQEVLTALSTRRVESTRLREFVCQQAYCLGEQKDFPNDFFKVTAALEVYNLSTYMINWVLDNKGSLDTQTKKNVAVIEGMRLYDAAQDLLLQTPFENKRVLQDGMRELNQTLYHGQLLDTDELTLSQQAHELPEKEYLRKYLQTSYKKCGAFMQYVTFAGSFLASHSPEKQRALQVYGALFGTGVQIVNDLADCVVVDKEEFFQKPQSDLFSDVENGFITPTTYMLLKNSSQKSISSSLSTKQKESLTKQLIDINAFYTGFRMASYLRKQAKKALASEFSSEQKKYLSSATVLLTSSKIHKLLREDCGYVYKKNLLSDTQEVLEEFTYSINDEIRFF
ncbi:MAG: polyprenyl synthetase family protein [Candidatus Woesearchaeota archaeon]